MSKEINVRVSMNATKGGVSVNTVGTSSPELTQIDMAGSDMAQASQLVPFAADEALEIPADLNPVGMIYLRNSDETNYIELSTGTGVNFAAGVFAKIRAKMPMLFQSVGTVYVKANTADVRLFFSAVEE